MSFSTYVFNRALQTIGTIIAVLTIVFLSARVIPGDPVLALAPQATPDTRDAIRAELGLNEPIHTAYIDWVIGFTRGDLGESIMFTEPVVDVILRSLPPAVSIGTLGFLVALTIGLGGGIISAMNKYKWKDNFVTILSFIGISMPTFWVGILLVLLVGVRFEFVPAFGYTPMSAGFVPWLSSVALPALSIGIPFGGILLRFTRSSLLDVMDKQYILTARSKGLPAKIVLYKHGFQNALIPIITMSGIVFAIALAGVVAVEIVFGINGFGRLLLTSLEQRDYPLVQGSVLVFAVIYVTTTFLLDIIYALANPKIRY
jgi:peptide/nickel transport system permease protein